MEFLRNLRLGPSKSFLLKIRSVYKLQQVTRDVQMWLTAQMKAYDMAMKE